MINKFIKCRNCGKYVAQEKAINNRYCSETCMNRFNVCIICGKYFTRGKGYNNEMCSQECSIAYKITKLYTSEDEQNI